MLVPLALRDRLNACRSWPCWLLHLLYCAACAAPPSATQGFGTPLSNQVPIHTDVPGQPHTHIDPSQATETISVALVASELILGPNRFAVGLLDGKGQAITEATVHVHYFDLSAPSNPRVESEAVRLASPDEVERHLKIVRGD